VKGTLRVDETHWINLMMDRTALLLPRLQRSERAPEQALERLLHALRLGLSVMHLRRSDTPPGREVDALFHRINAADRHALRERIAAIIEQNLPAADEQRASLSSGWWICTVHYGGQTMVNDLNIGGVFIPGLLMTALARWSVRCYSSRFSLSRLYRRLPFRPLMDVSTWIVTFFFAGPDRVGVIVMKSLLSLLARYALTLSASRRPRFWRL
jgi:hypothetical protein